MEKIKISELKKEISELNKLIEEYEFNFLNLYNEFNKLSNYWQDANAKVFYEEIELKKPKLKNTIEEIKEIANIYEYTYDKYEILGTKIDFNLNYKNKVIANCDNYISLLDDIITDYEGLDLSFCPYEARYLRNELFNLKQNKNNLIQYKNNVTEKIDYIENIEKNIKFKISKIKVETLNEFDINRFI